MGIEIYVLIAIVTLVASLVQSVTGFGFGIVAMIFLPSLLSFTEANVFSAILSTLTSVALVFVLFKKTNWKNLIFPLIGSTVANYFAITFVKSADNKTLTLLLGIVLFALSIFFLFFSDRIKIRPSWYTGLTVGVISGVMSGLFSIGGPPVVIYYMQSEKDMDTYLATISSYFVLSGIIAISMKVASGFVTVNVLIALAVGLVMMLIGFILGKAVRHKTNPNVIKKMVYGVMAVSGLVNVITSLI